MTITLPENNSKEFELTPAGTFAATCYRVIDLGTQLVEYKGEQKQQHKIMLSWELPDEKMNDGRPFSVHQKYTLSSHEKSNFRKHLESWRGVPFKDEDFGKFDIGTLIGKSCLIGVTHTHSNGNTYANITTPMRLPKGMAVAPLTNEIIYFSLNDFKQDVYDKLSEGLRATIARSPEYARLKGAHKIDEQVADDVSKHEPANNYLDDEIPF